MASYNEIYEAKLKKLQNDVVNTEIHDVIQVRGITSKRLYEIREKIGKVIDLPEDKVWNNHHYRAGKLMGILKTIKDKPKHREELYKITGLNDHHLSVYLDVSGNPPFLNTDKSKDNIIETKPQDCEAYKNLLLIVAAEMGIVIEPFELDDITPERFDRICEFAQKKAEADLAMRIAERKTTNDEEFKPEE